jgi:aldehyde:ferredoxin oxidoreductase
MREVHMNGYMEKILRIDLTERKIMIIPTNDYGQWVGGHGMGSAIFFDLVKDKTIDGFNPANVVTIMTSPLSGTLAPAGSGRTEVQGIGVQSYPIGWFTRSNFGGRFSSMLKYAGWDGIVIEGKADEPVWLDVRNDKVKIRDCRPLSLWETDTWECQKRIWNYVAGNKAYGDWIEFNGKGGGSTTQRPAVLAIGPAGENLSRMACLIHDASSSSGQGGFGAVWGSKNLKAVSVIGTCSIKIYDPKALMKARLWHTEKYAFDLDNRKMQGPDTSFYNVPKPGTLFGRAPGSSRPYEGQRPQACVGCHSGCRARYESGLGNEATCAPTAFYSAASSLDIQRHACDLLNKYGINAFEAGKCLEYLNDLNRIGVLGPGKKIDFPLNFQNYGSYAFVEQFIKMISCRNDGLGNESQAGDDLAEGTVRAAQKWGRLEGDSGDLKTGLLDFPYWGFPNHFEPRTELEWGYGTILGDRDINEHGFNTIFMDVWISLFMGKQPRATAEETVKIYTDKMVPFQGDYLMLDYGTENMYSEHIAKLVAWHRYYTRFWKQSALFCDWRWPDFINPYASNKVGSTGESEPKFLNAVTGKNFTFLDGIELGKKIWNLDHATWTLQGRHRDIVHFADYIYRVPYAGFSFMPSSMPSRKNGKWEYTDMYGRCIDREKFEEFKTRFYQLEGWDPDTGYPRRSTLTSLNLEYVGDELEKNGKLGKG